MHPTLRQLLAARAGHFQMESGYHSEQWFELGRLFAEPQRIRPLATELAHRLAAHRLDAVCGPMTGGAHLAALIADALSLECVIADRYAPLPGSPNLFPVRYRVRDEFRGRVSGRRIAIVDDAISAGSAIRGTHSDLLACGAVPVVLSALIVFGPHAARFAQESALALEAITHTEFNLWPPAECPLCQRSIPLETISDAR